MLDYILYIVFGVVQYSHSSSAVKEDRIHRACCKDQGSKREDRGFVRVSASRALAGICCPPIYLANELFLDKEARLHVFYPRMLGRIVSKRHGTRILT